MSEAERVTGIVLSAMPVGEFDKRLVLLTLEHGKITAFARGARRMKSSLMAATNPFVFGTFEVREGRDSYTLTGASVKEYFTELSSKMPGVYYGFYFLEVADYFGQEGNDERELLNLLYVTIRALLKGRLDPRLIRRIYELRVLTINGEYPDVFSCMHCGTTENLTTFSLSGNGICCSACGHLLKDGWELKQATVMACQYSISAPLERLYGFQLTEEILDEMERVVKAYFRRHVDKQMKSLGILESMI